MSLHTENRVNPEGRWYNRGGRQQAVHYKIGRNKMTQTEMKKHELNAEYNKLSRTIAYSALDTLSIKKMIALKEKADDWEVTLTYEL